MNSQSVTAFVFFCSLASGLASLYDPTDPLWQLDDSNFNYRVLGKNHAWIIEFYSSWCGHCIRFAPHWKELARDIENWKNVIDIGVVNCADALNVKLCRQYNVQSYPNIKLFGVNLTTQDAGNLLTSSRELPNIRKVTIQHLESLPKKPSHWPDLSELQQKDLNSMWNELPSSTTSVYLIIEKQDSYLGREIILDLSRQNLTARRILTSNDPLVSSLHQSSDNVTFVFLKIDRNNHKEILNVFDDVSNTTMVRDLIFETITGSIRVKDEIVSEENKTDEAIKEGIFMADLENAVTYALRQEVPVHSDISGPKFNALKNFTMVLQRYFPGSPNMMGFLIRLNKWLDDRKNGFSGERFLNALDMMTTDTEYLPEAHPFVGCKGSVSKFRGYPCSLWTLFHTLSVKAFDEYARQRPENAERLPQEVLYAMRGYITTFFSCENCADHFRSISANLENEATLPRDAVLWLWKKHNIVNKRLAGDATEDPKHPKIQFPSPDSCPKCRQTGDDIDIQWDESTVLQYLRFIYRTDGIKQVESSSQTDNENVRTFHGRQVESPSRDESFVTVLSFDKKAENNGIA